MRPVPSELGRGKAVAVQCIAWWLVFCVWGGGGCRVLVCCVVASVLRVGRGRAVALLACCLMVSLVRAEVSVPSVATSGCPKRSEGGCPCRSEDVHRPSCVQ